MTSYNGVYTPSPEPKSHPRVRPEAINYAERNRGDSEKWYDYSHPEDYSSPRPAERIISNEARRNADMNKGSMDGIMGGYNDPAVKQTYAERNRGDSEKWYDYSHPEDHSSPRPVERIISDEARRNADMNKGSMSGIMGGYCDPAVKQTVHPRAVKSEASEIAESNKGRSMKNLMDNYGNLGLSDRPGQKVRGDNAEEYAERNRGSMDNVIRQYGTYPPSDRPGPKLGLGGEEVAVKHTGADMGPILRMEGELAEENQVRVSRLHQASEGPGWDEDPPAYRTRPEAEDIVEKNTKTVSDKLMRGEVNPPTIREPRMLPHMEETPAPRKPSSPVRTRPEGMQNYQKNHSSEMAAIMRGEATTQSPSKKRNPNFYRSEDW